MIELLDSDEEKPLIITLGGASEGEDEEDVEFEQEVVSSASKKRLRLSNEKEEMAGEATDDLVEEKKETPLTSTRSSRSSRWRRSSGKTQRFPDSLQSEWDISDKLKEVTYVPHQEGSKCGLNSK